ncbi:MAG TPA: hypothetical protein VN648_07185, partial [Candidatus Methylomirabilis sp.]|nr:hypothetical protein [Candidatus Methylomirabilis sp.]
MKLVRNGLLVGLGLRQRSPGNILWRTRLLRLGPGLGRLLARLRILRATRGACLILAITGGCLLLIGLALALFARWLGRRLVLAALQLVGGWFRRFVLGSGRARRRFGNLLEAFPGPGEALFGRAEVAIAEYVEPLEHVLHLLLCFGIGD